MRKEREALRAKHADGQVLIGTHVAFSESSFTELLGDVGYDLVWIDTEHSPLDGATTLAHVIAARAAGVASLVRVPHNDPVSVKRVLDMGSDGIVFPMIRSVEEAKTALSLCQYPPSGVRGMGPRRASRYGLDDRSAYISNAYDELLKIMQIEHIDNLQSLEGIIALEGVDGIVIGPSDFSASLGLAADPYDKTLQAAFDQMSEIVRGHDILFGVSMGWDRQLLQQWLGRGVNWINVGFEYQFLLQAARSTLTGVTELVDTHHHL
jgi:2-keto-3-deoxy-L-rhamnonate aldolase RhmA